MSYLTYLFHLQLMYCYLKILFVMMAKRFLFLEQYKVVLIIVDISCKKNRLNV